MFRTYNPTRSYCLAVSWLLVAARWAAALPPNVYERHAFFVNASPCSSYSHSQCTVVSPSTLGFEDDSCPIDSERFHSPPNSLRLTWKSAAGGDWRVALRLAGGYGHQTRFAGDTVSLWCFSEEGLAPAEGPRIFLQDSTGAGVTTIALLAEPLPAGKWIRLRLPLKNFRGQYGSTDDSKFDAEKLATITLLQNLEDGKSHTLYVDDVSIVDGNATDDTPPPRPEGLSVVGQDCHFDLAWRPNLDQEVMSYVIHRSWDGTEFTPVGVRPGWSCRAVDFVGGSGKKAYYRVTAVDAAENESPPSDVASSVTRLLNDEQLLDMVQAGCYRYYWEAANPESGMALEILPGDANLVAVGASGFGIMAQIAATERQFISREESVRRTLQIVRFLKRADRFHGAFPHFLDGRTGRVNAFFGKYDNGGDLVETAFLMQGMLAARQYFNQQNEPEREIRATISELWQAVEWDWYRKDAGSDVLYWHWSPDHGWHISHPLIGWNETFIVYLLAIASPTHGVPASMFYSGWAGQSESAVQYRRSWSRTAAGDHYANGNTYYGIKLDVGSGTGGDLFFTQFSFLGFDPRGMRDRYTNYFENNRRIALINRAYCIDNPRKFAGYGENCWGLSAGIHSGGGRPLPRDDNGTICSSAALGSFPYTPAESMSALKHFYRTLGPKIWGAYGFHDGFNETENWFDEVYMGLNQAQVVVGIENSRSGLLWRSFMANPEIAPALKAAGLRTNPDRQLPER